MTDSTRSTVIQYRRISESERKRQQEQAMTPKPDYEAAMEHARAHDSIEYAQDKGDVNEYLDANLAAAFIAQAERIAALEQRLEQEERISRRLRNAWRTLSLPEKDNWTDWENGHGNPVEAIIMRAITDYDRSRYPKEDK